MMTHPQMLHALDICAEHVKKTVDALDALEREIDRLRMDLAVEHQRIEQLRSEVLAAALMAETTVARERRNADTAGLLTDRFGGRRAS